MPTFPYIIQGTVYQSIGKLSYSHTIVTTGGGVIINIGAGTIVKANQTITITNINTNSFVQVVSDSNGLYSYDLNNLGYTLNDVITITTEFSTNVDSYPLTHVQTPIVYRKSARALGVTLFDQNGYAFDNSNPIHVRDELTANIKSTAVSVSTSAVKLPTTVMEGRRSILIYNNHASNILYVGDNNVTTSTGIPIAAASDISIDVTDDVILYGIASGASTDVRILEMS